MRLFRFSIKIIGLIIISGIILRCGNKKRPIDNIDLKDLFSGAWRILEFCPHNDLYDEWVTDVIILEDSFAVFPLSKEFYMEQRNYSHIWNLKKGRDTLFMFDSSNPSFNGVWKLDSSKVLSSNPLQYSDVYLSKDLEDCLHLSRW